MIRRPPRSTQSRSSAASDVYKRQHQSMRFNRPEIWMLTTIFAIGGLVLIFGRVADEVLEGDTTKFDQTILLLFRNANDPTNPIGPLWVEGMARDVTALGSYAVLS